MELTPGEAHTEHSDCQQPVQGATGSLAPTSSFPPPITTWLPTTHLCSPVQNSYNTACPMCPWYLFCSW